MLLQAAAGDAQHLAAAIQNAPHKGRNLVFPSVLPQRVCARPQIVSRPEEFAAVCVPQT
jgi:hypothetical protein